MRHHRTVLRTGTAALFGVALASAPAAAWQPTTISADLPSTEVGTLTDMAARNQRVAVSFDVSYPAGGPSSGPGVDSYDNAGGVAWSTNSGATWFSNEIDLANKPTEPAVTICKGHVVLMMVVQPSGSGTYGIYQHGINISDQTVALRYWSENPQHRRVRHPDIACIANEMFAVAWFQEKAGGDYTVKLRTGNQRVNHLSSVLDLGAGSPGKGLSVAATADRVYVSWFSGTKLRLARYRIGSAPSYTLTKLGTSTITTLTDGTSPEIGADGSRVVLAYSSNRDLKVRRSTNKGVSFGGSKTLWDLPAASALTARPITVAVAGNHVAIGGAELTSSSPRSGSGIGFESTDGGSNYTWVSHHVEGKVVTALVEVGDSWHYAEAWDQTVETQGTGTLIRYRRE